MTRQDIGIEEARKRLGDLVTVAQQGTDVILTRNGKPAARIVRYIDEVVTVADIAAAVGMRAAPEKVAMFAGCFTEPDFARTGRLPKPWHGKGLAAEFTRDEADQIITEWHEAASDAEAGHIYEPSTDPNLAEAQRRHVADVAAVRERYRP